MSAASPTREDLFRAFAHWRLWMYLSWSDIRIRYRGSYLGPLWITLSMILFIASFSVVYARLFTQSIQSYVPFLASGYVLWLLISGAITEATCLFIDSGDLIREIKLPYFLHVFRLIWRQTLVFLHNFVVTILVLLYFQISISWHQLLFIPGFVLGLCALTFMSLLLALLGAKYRDVPPIVQSLLQIVFFVSPISWQPHLIGKASLIVHLNPFTYFLDITRAPLLGQLPEMQSWIFCASFTLLLGILTFWIFQRKQYSIPFWL